MPPAPQPAPSSSQFVGSIPELYDRHLGPFFFERYAKDLAGRLSIPASATRVLEIAAGTGILSQRLRERLPAAVKLVATDLNESMLAIGKKRLSQAKNVEFREADAQALPFPSATFDAVVCQFGVMFFPDKALAAHEAKRVLEPGGQWLFSVWGSLGENPVARVANEVVRSFFPDDPPPFFQVPFGFSEPSAVRALAEDAGFTKVTVTDVRLTAQSPSAVEAATGFVQGSPMALMILERGVSLEKVTAATATALAREFGDRPLETVMLARVIAATA